MPSDHSYIPTDIMDHSTPDDTKLSLFGFELIGSSPELSPVVSRSPDAASPMQKSLGTRLGCSPAPESPPAEGQRRMPPRRAKIKAIQV